MFKLIILFIIVTVFSIFALNDFLDLWACVREGLEYFNKVLLKNIKILDLFKPMIRSFFQNLIFQILGTILHFINNIFNFKELKNEKKVKKYIRY